MNRLFMPLMAIVCLLLTACDKDEIIGPPMDWTWDILTPESVEWEDAGLLHYSFKANGNEGALMMTCDNYDALSFAGTSSDTYDCGWATLRIEANQLEIHFPYNVSDSPEASEEITISGKNGKQKSRTVIHLSRTFNKEERPDPEPEQIPQEAKFKMIKADVTPFMQNDNSPLPAPLDLITFRITDINDNYSLLLPQFTQYYDSIVWSAEGYPHTYKIYENTTAEAGTETHYTSQWSSFFFKSGTIKNHLKGYRDGKVEYETSLNVTLYERDFLGFDWGIIVLANPKNLTYYCRLDTDYEYQVDDIVLRNNAPFSEITPANYKQLSESEFLAIAPIAIKRLMKDNVGEGQSAKGKESLFKCLPEKGVEAELFWETKTTRMLMLHQLSNDPDDIIQEKYYLHLEPKQ